MNAIIIEVDGLIAEMKALDKFNDDVFIQYFEKVGEMQERLSELEKTNKLSSVEYKDCSDKLSPFTIGTAVSEALELDVRGRG